MVGRASLSLSLSLGEFPLSRECLIVPDWIASRHVQRIPCVSVVLICRVLQEMMANFAAWPIRSIDEWFGLTSAEAFEFCENLNLTTVLDTVSSSAVLAEGPSPFFVRKNILAARRNGKQFGQLQI
jgi:hypothetical protein